MMGLPARAHPVVVRHVRSRFSLQQSSYPLPVAIPASGMPSPLCPDGYRYVHDSMKDMIISGGENVYPSCTEIDRGVQVASPW
jgi:hypothetical protein